MTPIIIAKENPFRMAPPKIKIDKRAKSVVTDVIIVLDKVSFIEVLAISEILPQYHSLNNQQ